MTLLLIVRTPATASLPFAAAASLKAVTYKADAAVEFRINPLLLPGC